MSALESRRHSWFERVVMLRFVPAVALAAKAPHATPSPSQPPSPRHLRFRRRATVDRRPFHRRASAARASARVPPGARPADLAIGRGFGFRLEHSSARRRTSARAPRQRYACRRGVRSKPSGLPAAPAHQAAGVRRGRRSVAAAPGGRVSGACKVVRVRRLRLGARTRLRARRARHRPRDRRRTHWVLHLSGARSPTKAIIIRVTFGVTAAPTAAMMVL